MKTLLISAGHSNADPGAIANNRREADITVEFRNMVSFYLTQAGVPHDTDGTGTVNYPLPIAARSAARHDIAVEFHCNAAASRTASGCEALCNESDNALAAAILGAIRMELAIPNRGVKPENAGQHSRLAFVRAGGIIVELLFITAPGDLLAYDTRKWRAAQRVATVLQEACQ